MANEESARLLVIARESARQVEVVRLLDEANRRSRSLYPEESLHGLDVEALEEQGASAADVPDIE